MHAKPEPKRFTPTILLLSTLWLAATPALAQSAACAPGAATSLEKRLLALDHESPDALRRFIQRTGPIYQLNWHDTKTWLNSRKDGSACVAGTDAAKPAGPQATTTR